MGHTHVAPTSHAVGTPHTSHGYPDFPWGGFPALPWAEPEVGTLSRRFLRFLEVVSRVYILSSVGQNGCGIIWGRRLKKPVVPAVCIRSPHHFVLIVVDSTDKVYLNCVLARRYIMVT